MPKTSDKQVHRHEGDVSISRMPLTARSIASAVLLLMGTGCLDDDYFVGPPTGEGVFTFAMAETTTPTIGEFVHVEARVELPLQPPTDEELAALGGNATPPYFRTPWLLNRELSVEIDITIKNLDPDPRTLAILADGISEFHEYVPGYVVEIENGEIEVIPNPSQWERNLLIQGNEILTRTIRQEELDEVAVDLATIANGAPNPNQVNFAENHSSTDERARPFIPETIAGLVGVRLGLLRNGPANLVVEASVRVRDREGRIADPQDPTTWWELPAPEVLMPEGAVLSL